MPRIIDMVGGTFGRLTVLSRAGLNKHGAALWNCLCSCGSESISVGHELRTGHKKSCGCWRVEQIGTVRRTHAKSHSSGYSATYNIWKGMRARCNSPRAPFYERYGGAGIRICPRWDDYAKFLEDMGPAERGMTLDRIDPAQDYSPENCRWASAQQQAMNRRTPSVNSSGLKNVRFRGGKWIVAVSVHRKKYFFGAHSDKEFAGLVAYEARRRLHGEFANHD